MVTLVTVLDLPTERPHPPMYYYGISLFLLVAGLFTKFALKANVAGIDRDMLGNILIGIALLGFLLSFFLQKQATSRRTEVHENVHPDGVDRVIDTH